MALDKNEIGEDRIHIGVTGPPGEVNTEIFEEVEAEEVKTEEVGGSRTARTTAKSSPGEKR